VTGAVEGVVDEVVMRRLGDLVGRPLETVYVTEGAGNLFRRLPGFNAAAARAPWFVLADLDTVACAPELIRSRLPAPNAQMVFRVAVREIEAWLMADRQMLARFLSVALSRLPLDPDAVENPKQTLVNIARRSRRGDIRRDMVPSLTSGRRVGPAYESRLIQFITGPDVQWRPEEAANFSDSLKRCVEALRRTP
jgi:hypothetical protein